jgi:hypothetical protein
MKNLICIYLFLCVIIPANLFAQKEGERIMGTDTVFEWNSFKNLFPMI